MPVTFGPNGYALSAGQSLLNPQISELIDQTASIAGINQSDKVLEDLGFVKYTPLTPDEKISSMRSAKPATKFGEGEVTPVQKRDQGYEKSLKMEKYGVKFAISDEFLAWLESGKTIDGADSSVKREWMKIANEVETAMRSLDMTKSIIATAVISEGDTATEAYGPGSIGGDGKALFATDHPNGGYTLNNKLGTALDATNLLAAINAMKAFKSETGYLLQVPSVFTLVVPRALESTARSILNSTSDQAGLYAGTANNANLLNTFMFTGQKVELVIADWMNQTNEVLPQLGATLGSATTWFLLNKEKLKEVKGLRFMSLWDKRVETWREYDTGLNYVKVSMYANADSFNAHQFIAQGNV